MTGPITASNVFLDTEVFIEANFDYTSPRFAALAKLAGDNRIRIFLTDLTVCEIKANIKEAVERAASPRSHPILRNSTVAQVKDLLRPLDRTEIENDLFDQLEEFIKAADITVLPIDGEFLGPVLDDYFNRLPPFGPGKNKAEFPDALAIKALKAWCESEGRNLAVVTRDAGVKAACLEGGSLYHYDDLPRYLDAVASENKALSGFIRDMMIRHDREVLKMAEDAFSSLAFYLSDLDGDVDNVELQSIDYDGPVSIISLAADEAIIEMPATLNYQADVSYYVPGTGSYDSEDRVLLFQDTAAATVKRKAHRSVSVHVTFEDVDPGSFQVEDVTFDSKQDISVVSDYEEDWPYK